MFNLCYKPPCKSNKFRNSPLKMNPFLQTYKDSSILHCFWFTRPCHYQRTCGSQYPNDNGKYVPECFQIYINTRTSEEVRLAHQTHLVYQTAPTPTRSSQYFFEFQISRNKIISKTSTTPSLSAMDKEDFTPLVCACATAPDAFLPPSPFTPFPNYLYPHFPHTSSRNNYQQAFWFLVPEKSFHHYWHGIPLPFQMSQHLVLTATTQARQDHAPNSRVLCPQNSRGHPDGPLHQSPSWAGPYSSTHCNPDKSTNHLQGLLIQHGINQTHPPLLHCNRPNTNSSSVAHSLLKIAQLPTSEQLPMIASAPLGVRLVASAGLPRSAQLPATSSLPHHGKSSHHGNTPHKCSIPHNIKLPDKCRTSNDCN